MNSEFLIEGNYFDKDVTNFYSQRDAMAVTWNVDNFIAEASELPSSFGATVSVPYEYKMASAANVRTIVKGHAGATLF
jgi:pectate lyase